MRRFYTRVAVAPEPGGFGVLLDGKPWRTGGRHVLRLPTRALADAVAEEWAGQGQVIDPAGMHLTQLAAGALDLTPGRRAELAARTSGYGATDLLCYRAATPHALTIRQHQAWQPWLDWAERKLGGRLVPHDGIMPGPQDPEALRRLQDAVLRLDDWRLVGLHAAVALTGSMVLGLAGAQGELAPEPAFTVAMLDELFEIERWGEDPEQQDRHRRIRAELAAAARFLELLARAG